MHLVAVEQINGHYVAESLSFPELRAEAATEDLAVARVTLKVRERLRTRKIVRIDVPNYDLLHQVDIFAELSSEMMQAVAAATSPTRAAERTRDETIAVASNDSSEGISALFGKYRDDETLTEIRDEAYRQRDEATLPGASHDSLWYRCHDLNSPGQARVPTATQCHSLR